LFLVFVVAVMPYSNDDAKCRRNQRLHVDAILCKHITMIWRKTSLWTSPKAGFYMLCCCKKVKPSFLTVSSLDCIQDKSNAISTNCCIMLSSYTRITTSNVSLSFGRFYQHCILMLFRSTKFVRLHSPISLPRFRRKDFLL
jgi:hypothetical protein